MLTSERLERTQHSDGRRREEQKGSCSSRHFFFVFGAVAAAMGIGLTIDLLVPRALADRQAGQSATPPGSVTPVMTSPLDQPLQLLGQASQIYQQRVQDYTCTLVKQERVKGQLQPEHVIDLKFRKQPFSVYMRWQTPRNMAGQQVCYVEGKNNGLMRVHSTGILGAVGWVSIHPQDPRVLEHSRHVITETGFGNLITRCSQDWARERNFNRTRASVAEYDFNGARCIRIEVAYTERVPTAYCYRSVLYLDKQTRMPVRAECYDWPVAGSQSGGELLEVFSYLRTRFNVGLTEKDFTY